MMFFSGLKMQITATLAVLLLLVMLLGNIVVIAFWQKGASRSAIEHVRTVWGSAFFPNVKEQGAGQFQFQKDFRFLCANIGRRCVGVVLSDGSEFWSKNKLPEVKKKCLKLAQQSARSQTEIIRFNGNPWGILPLKKKYIFIAKPVPVDTGKELKSAVVVISQESFYESIVENHTALILYLLVNVLTLTLVGSFRLINIMVKPIDRMVGMSKSYQGSEVLLFNEEQKRSEFGQLSSALNSMLFRIESDRAKLRKTVTALESANLKLLKTQKEMIRTEKIASVGRLSAGLAHEIGNPLGIIQGYVELLQQPDLDQSEKKQFGERALGELTRVNKLIRQLLDYAGSSSHEMSVVGVGQLFEGICQMIAIKKYNPPISLLKDIPSDIAIQCDSESLRQVFLNCLLNALDAIESKTGNFEREIKITAEEIVEEESHQTNVFIKIEDNGIGINEKDFEAIFDPFYTTKDPGKGTGLGLFVSHSIIDAHGGKIWVESTYGKGSTINITLPVYTEADQRV